MAENQSSSKHCSTWVFQAVIGPRPFLQGWQAGIVNWSRKALCSSNMLLLDILSDCLTWCGIPTSKLCLFDRVLEFGSPAGVVGASFGMRSKQRAWICITHIDGWLHCIA
jgi:hypothetical protein